MKYLIILILSIIGLNAQSQTRARYITLDPGLDKNKTYVLVSDTTHVKYRYGKGTWMLKDTFLAGASGGGFFTGSTATDETEHDGDGNDFQFSNAGDIAFQANNDIDFVALEQAGLSGADVSIQASNGTITLDSDDSLYVISHIPKIDINNSVDYTIGVNSDGAVESVPVKYKVYTALLTQSGTSAPVATVLENTLGGTVVWSYNNVGLYEGTLSGAFPVTNTVPELPIRIDSGKYSNTVSVIRNDNNSIYFSNEDGDDVGYVMYMSVKVYQ